jgi:hypothetical protein
MKISSYEAHHHAVFFNFVLGLVKTGVAQIDSYLNTGEYTGEIWGSSGGECNRCDVTQCDLV